MFEAISDFYTVPYPFRLALVLSILSVVAIIDWKRKGNEASRWREYLFWLLCAFLGTVFAVFNDLITSRISPEYFTIGKGLSAGESLSGDVAGLAAQAGFIAGILIGGALLMANNPRKELPQLPYKRLATELALPPVLALLLVIPGMLLASQDLFKLRPELAPHMGMKGFEDFLRVQGIHLGLYLGAGIGTVLGVLRIRKARMVGSPSTSLGAF